MNTSSAEGTQRVIDSVNGFTKRRQREMPTSIFAIEENTIIQVGDPFSIMAISTLNTLCAYRDSVTAGYLLDFRILSQRKILCRKKLAFFSVVIPNICGIYANAYAKRRNP